MNTMYKVMQSQNVNFNMVRLNEFNNVEAVALPFIPDSNSDVFDNFSDGVLDKIRNLTMIVSAGLGTFVAGYVYLLLLAKLEIGI